MVKRIISLVFFLCLVFVARAQKDKSFETIETDDDNIRGICFTEHGGVLAVADNNNIRAFSMETNAMIATFNNGHHGQILSIDISHDSLLLASGGKDNRIIIWDFTNGKILQTLDLHEGIVTSVKFSPDGRYLVYGSTDDKVYLFDIRQSKFIHDYSGHSDDVTSVDFNPDGNLFASGSADGTIGIYSVEDTTFMISLTGHRSWVRDIEFSADSSKLISCGDDSRIITWNFKDLKNIIITDEINMNSGWITGVSYYDDNQTYASGYFNGKVRITLNFGGYHYKPGGPVNQVLLQPGQGQHLKLAIATRGKGVILLDSKNMRFYKRGYYPGR